MDRHSLRGFGKSTCDGTIGGADASFDFHVVSDVPSVHRVSSA